MWSHQREPVDYLVIYIVIVSLVINRPQTFRKKPGVSLEEVRGPIFTGRFDLAVSIGFTEDRGMLTSNHLGKGVQITGWHMIAIFRRLQQILLEGFFLLRGEILLFGRFVLSRGHATVTTPEGRNRDAARS